jgi:hypothetical protein
MDEKTRTTLEAAERRLDAAMAARIRSLSAGSTAGPTEREAVKRELNAASLAHVWVMVKAKRAGELAPAGS